jgi:hypothetical protein
MQNACVILYGYKPESTTSFIDMRLVLYRFWFQLIVMAFELRPKTLVFSLGYQHSVRQESVLIAVYLVLAQARSDDFQCRRLERWVRIRMRGQQKRRLDSFNSNHDVCSLKNPAEAGVALRMPIAKATPNCRMCTNNLLILGLFRI